jgi:alpha-tubulin suppressor-like RCC1 family protein
MLSQSLSGAVTVSLTSTAGSQTNLAAIPVAVNFSEDVENITVSSFEVTNGTVTSIVGSGSQYNLVITPSGDGPVSVKFSPSKVDIKKGSGSKEQIMQKNANATPISVVADTVAPTVALTSLVGDPTNKSTVEIKIEFSEEVMGFDITQVTAMGTGASLLSVTGSGKTYTAKVAATVTGTVGINLAAGNIHDKAGNMLGAGSQLTVTYDPTLPIPNITTTVPAISNVSSIPVTVSFGSINVTGVSSSDFTITNGTLSGLTGSGATYSLTITPTADGDVTIMMNADTAVSASGVGNIASNQLSIKIDREPPSITIGSPNVAAGTSNTEFVWPITYDGASLVTLNAADITLSGVTTATVGCSKTVVAQDAKVYLVKVTGCTGAGEIGFYMAASTARDAAGNYSYAPGVASGVIVDNQTYIANFSKYSDIVNEGSTANTQSFTINLNTPAVSNVTVQYRILNGFSTVTASDYTLSTNTVVLSAGQSSATVNYTYKGNTSADGNKIIQIGMTDMKAASGTLIYSTVPVSRRLIIDEESDNIYTQVSAGNTHTCGITTAQVLKCWGASNHSATNGFGASPVVMDAGVLYAKVAAGVNTSCAITAAGVLKCWGSNSSGQLGDGSTTTRTGMVVVDSGTSYVNVAVGSQFVCGITTSNRMKCWGNNTYGQIGNGSTVTQTSPVLIDSGSTYKSIATGANHACGITTSDVLKCWGYNSSGQLGNGGTTNQTSPVVIDSGVSYSNVSAGTSFTCGVTTTGQLKCWGLNTAGQLGIGNTTNQILPMQIPDSVNSYYKVSAGSGSACAITTVGALKCWGLNNLGLLGDGTLVNQPSPVAVDPEVSYAQISAGQSHFCGVNSDGVVKCWGTDSYGQTGQGLSQVITLPTKAEDASLYSKVSAGNSQSCGIVASSGQLKCWGYNLNGELGDGVSGTIMTLPKVIDRGFSYIDVSVGLVTSCGITSGNVLKCWGSASDGQLGDNTNVSKYKPVVVDPGVGYQKVSIRDYHACGITLNNVLKCWGRNSTYQLGDGTATKKLVPTVIDPGVPYAYVSVGDTYTCGVTSAGVAKCWGMNNYYQASSTAGTVMTPTVVDGGVAYTQVEAGGAHTCGITASKDLKCWGYNTSGQIGDGTIVTATAPVLIDAGVSYSVVNTGSVSTCAITVAGTLKCWGNNNTGSVGNGSIVTALSPVIIDSAQTYSAVDVGTAPCGITTSGVLMCWGSDMYGLAGTGRLLNRPAPIAP